MTEGEARAIARRHVAELQRGASVALSIDHVATESAQGYVFFYNTA